MRVLLITLPLLFASCAAAGSGGGHPKASDAGLQQSESKSKGNKGPDMVALEFKVALAKRRQASSEMAAKISHLEALSKVEKAERDLDQAQAALEHFDGFTAPVRLGKADLGLDRSRGRLEDGNYELVEILAMYGGEELADSSMEMVVERARRSAEFSKRSLAFAEQEREDLEAFDLAKQRSDFVLKIKASAKALDLARMRLGEKLFGIETKASEAAEGLRKAQAELAKAAEKAGA